MGCHHRYVKGQIDDYTWELDCFHYGAKRSSVVAYASNPTVFNGAGTVRGSPHQTVILLHVPCDCQILLHCLGQREESCEQG